MIELINYLKYLEEKIDSHLKWRKEEYDKGYHDGKMGRGYKPSSQPYADGYKSGEWAGKYY